MQTKPIFIGLAAGILVLVVAAASFAAGVYIGKSGQAAQGQSQIGQGGPGQGADGNGPQGGQSQNGQAGPNGQGGPRGGGQNGPQSGQPSQGGFGPQGPAGAPSWPPDSIGHITAITDTQFTYENREGTVFTITFDASTKFIDADGAEISVSDLKIGDVIAVFGTDVATTIMQMPPKPAAPVAAPTTAPTAQPIP